MIKIISLLLVVTTAINVTSCQEKRNSYEIDIEGHTFLRVTERNSQKVLFEPCSASIETFKFYKDSIYHNWGQEYDKIKNISKEDKTEGYLLKGYNDNLREISEIKISRPKGKDIFWTINNKIFIDSIKFERVKLEKEKCEEEVEKEEIVDYETISHVKQMSFSTDCASDEYVYFLVGGQFITKNISLNTRLKKINEREFNIFFSPPLMNPVPSTLKDVESFSLSKPIAKANHIGNEIQFEWYGFYNRKTHKTEFKENPFTNKIESSFIVLKRCIN